MLFAGDRDIIGYLQSFPPKPIYGKGNEIAYDPDFGDTFGSDDADLNWAIPDPDRPTIYGSDVLDLLIQNEQVMKPGQSPGDDRSKEPYDKGWPAPAPLAPKLANKIVGYEDWTIDGPPEQGPIPSLRNTRSIDQGKLKSLMDELADMRLRGVL